MGPAARRVAPALVAAALALSLGISRNGKARADAGLDAARAYFHQGVAQARNGDWRSALEAFSAAYRIAPHASVLFNLAGAQLRCGQLLASNTNYHRLLADADEGVAAVARLSPAQRRAVARQVALIEQRIPRLRLHVAGLRSDDRVLLDQIRVYPDELDRDLWVDPGSHLVRVFRSRGEAESRTVVVSEGELRVLALNLP